MAKVSDALKEELNQEDEFDAKKKALKKQQQDPEYTHPQCTKEELDDIFGGK